MNARDIAAQMTGAPVTLTVDLGGKRQTQFSGKLVFVSPEVDPVNGQVRVWAQIENRDLQLRPGLRASMSIDSSEVATAARR